ncbi:MAG: glycosyltransferase [Acidobacteria bacterium]|nr:MAG: glycosyltransferase [Acidobacteriota bacterium]
MPDVKSANHLHTCIIPYARRPRSLFKCLESLRWSGCPSEIIVVDMYDEHLDLSRFHARYIPLRSPASHVFSKAPLLNHGVAAATGTYVSIVDCDMIISPGWFEDVSAKMDATTVVVTPVFMQSEPLTANLLSNQIGLSQFMAHRGWLNGTGRSQITLLRQHLLRQPYDIGFVGYGAEDTEINERLARSLRFREAERPFYHLFHYRTGGLPGYYERLEANRAHYRSLIRKASSRLGIYVASYNASKVLRTHLAQIARFTESPFDYYIADNSADPGERSRFQDIVREFDFATVVNSPSRHHGDTLQFLVENTSNELIALFDVDAFPLKPWDRWAVESLGRKLVVGVLSYVDCREIDYHLHPCFMVFTRRFLTGNQLHLRAGRLPHTAGGRLPLLDPAGAITCWLRQRGMFNHQHVEALIPTGIEVPFGPAFQWGPHRNLRRGFGVTYNNMIFHFWYGRHLQTCQPIFDDRKSLAVSPEQIREVLRRRTQGAIAMPSSTDNSKTIEKGAPRATSQAFAAGQGLAAAIRDLVAPGSIALDLGTGCLVTARALATRCRRVISLEQNQSYYQQAVAQAPGNVELIHAPLKEGQYPYEYFGHLDAVVVDRPQGDKRDGCLPWLANLEPGGLVFLDDTHRAGTQKLLAALLQTTFEIVGQGKDGEERTWAALRKKDKAAWIDLFMLSFNRSEYNEMTLASLLESDCGVPWEKVRFTVIDNASNDSSVEVIARFIRRHPGVIDRFLVADRNYGASGGIGYFLSRCRPQAALIGKIDNDSLFTNDWLQKLLFALRSHPRLGVVAAQEDANQGRNHNLFQNERGHGFYPARFVGGRFLARREVFNLQQPGGSGVWGWTEFQVRQIAGGGWKIGWCYPPCVIEHVGDWRFRHPRAIRDAKYVQYLTATGRLRQA